MTGGPPAKAPSKARSGASRTERLAEVLRANLKRRKDAARSREGGPGRAGDADEHNKHDE